MGRNGEKGQLVITEKGFTVVQYLYVQNVSSLNIIVCSPDYIREGENSKKVYQDSHVTWIQI